MSKVSDDEEVKRLVRGLEAFAFAAGIDREKFIEALRAVVQRHDVAAAAMPATSPLKPAVIDAPPAPPILTSTELKKAGDR